VVIATQEEEAAIGLIASLVAGLVDSTLRVKGVGEEAFGC